MQRLSSAKLVLAITACGITWFSYTDNAGAFEDDWRDLRLEAPLGFDNVAEIDRGIQGNRDELGRRVEISGPYGSSLASALGNSISVEAGVGATVVINAQQINRGNQRATTIIDGDTAERMFQTEPAAGPSN